MNAQNGVGGATSLEVQRLLNMSRAGQTVGLAGELSRISSRNGIAIQQLLLLVRNESHENILLVAAASGALATLSYLFDGNLFEQHPGFRQQLLVSTTMDGDNAVHRAASNGHIDALLQLYHYRCDIFATNHHGFSAVMMAVAHDHHEMADTIVTIITQATPSAAAAAAIIHRPKRDGETPLHLAARHGNLDTANLLVENGAAIDARSASGSTPLFGAAENCSKEIVALLLSHGANPTIRNSAGETAWAVALRNTVAPGGAGGALNEIWRAHPARRG